MKKSQGIISGAEAADLLMLPNVDTLHKVGAKGYFKAIEQGQWRISDVVQGYVRYLHDRKDTLKSKEVMEVLGVSRQWVYQLEKDGIIKRTGVNAYPLEATVRAYIKHLRSEDRRSTKSAADSRVRDARAAEIELRVAERTRRLVDVEEAISAMQTVVGMIRTVMGGIAARVTRDLQLRKTIEKAINDGLNLVVSRLREEIVALRGGGQSTATVAADDAERMGTIQ